MNRLKSIALAMFAVFFMAAAIIPAAPASAQSSSAALSIVPKKNYVIEPGKSIRDTLVIRNLDSEKTLDLTLRVIDFSFLDEGGAPQLMLAEDAPQTTWSLKPFLSVPKNVSIPPKQSKTLNMSISIPEGQGAGSFYSAIMYASGSSEGGNVGLSASGVTLVFTTIPGEVHEDLTLQKFGAYHQDGTGKGNYTWITADMPLNMAYTLKNDGNVTESPVGSITLKHMFGQEYTINDVNPNQSLALIGQTRTFVSCIKQSSQEVDFNGTRSDATTCVPAGLWPGLYTASLDLYYGQNGNRTQEIVGSAFFIYLPWWFVVAFLFVAAIIAYFVWRIVRAVRSRLYGTGYRRSRMPSSGSYRRRR